MNFRTPYPFLLLPLVAASPFTSIIRLLSTHPKPRLPLLITLLLSLSACNSTIHTHGGWLRATRTCQPLSSPLLNDVAPDLAPLPETDPWPISPTLPPQRPTPSLWQEPPPEIELLPPIALPPFQMLEHLVDPPSWHALVFTY